MHPITIGGVLHRIVVKATLFVVGEGIVSAAGPLQTCAGHAAGSEAAVHVKELFNDNECEAALLLIVLIIKLCFITFQCFQCFVYPFQPSFKILTMP